MDDCWHTLKENRWTLAGVVMIVAAVLAVGAAAQHQLSNTSLAITVPLQELVAAASSRHFSSLAQVSQGINTAEGEGVLGQRHQVGSSNSVLNDEFRITPVKLTQEVPAEFPDQASEDPGTISLEADDPFFIVVDDESVSEPSGGAADTPPHGQAQADIILPSDHTEPPFSGTEIEATVITPDAEESQTTQHISNTVDDPNQSSFQSDDGNIIELSGVSVNRDAKSNEGVNAVDGKKFVLHSFTEDFVDQAEHSFDIASEDVITKSTSVNTPSLEAQFEGPTDFSQTEVTTETFDRELSTGVFQEDTPPTGPSPTDFQAELETSLEEPSPGSVSSLENPTPDSVFAEVAPINLSPAPVPVKISLDDPTLAPIPAKILLQEPTSNQLKIEIPEGTVPEGGKESQDIHAPEAIRETVSVDSGLQEIVETKESSGAHITAEPPSEAPTQEPEPNVAAQGGSLLDPAITDVILAPETIPQIQSPTPGTQERLVIELTAQSPTPRTQERLVTELNAQSPTPGTQERLVTELNAQSPTPGTQERLVTELNAQSPTPGTQERLVTELSAQSLTPRTQERLVTELTEAVAPIAAADAASISEPLFGEHRVSKDTVLLVEGLPEGDGNAPEDTVDPFAPEIENFNLDPPIDAQELAVVPEWIADDPVSGVIFDHSEVIQDPPLPMDDIELFFVAGDPQGEDQEKEPPGETVTEVKQQLLEDEVHIAALEDNVPFSPAPVHLSQEMQDAVRDAIQAQIAAMDVFGMKVPVEAAAAPPPSPLPPPPPPPPPAPTVDFAPHLAPAPSPNPPLVKLTPAPAPAPAPQPILRPAPQPNIKPAQLEIQKLPRPVPTSAAAPIFEPSYFSTPAPAPVTQAPKPVRPTYQPTPKPTRPTYRPRPEPTRPTYRPRPEPTRPTYRPRPAPTSPTYPTPKPARPTYRPRPEPTRPAYHPTPKPTRPTYPTPKPTRSTYPTPKPTRPTYPTPKPTRSTYPTPKPTSPTYPTPKPTRPTYRPRPKPTHPTYQSQTQPTHPTSRPRRPSSRPTKPATYPPAPPKASPPTHAPGRPPISYVHVQEPKPQHFRPPSHYGSPHPPPVSHHVRPRPRPRPRPTPPSYKPPPPATYTHHRPSYSPRPTTQYKPPASTAPPPSYHKPAPRPKPSYGTHHKDTHYPTTKPHYRPTQVTHKPHKVQKPILAPVLVPVDLHSVLIPKGVPSFTYRKPRPPSPFHIPFFFRSGRKQRLQVPESVKSRLDSDQPEWVADLEPKRR